MVYTCIYNVILAIKNNEILPFPTTWMDLEVKLVIMWNKSDRERQMLHDLTYCGILKKKTPQKRINITKQKQSYRYREQTVARREGSGGGKK